MLGRISKSALAGAVLAAASITVAPAPAQAAADTCQLPVFGAGASYRPRIRPGEFSPRVTNPYFPLTVGRTYVYAGLEEGEHSVDIVVPTAATRVVDGVRTRVVQDRLYLGGILRERTADYYSQDRCGNVWYFGEDTAELDVHGHVTSTEGSFHAGVDGAQPGVFMQAHPQLGRRFRQEWYPGQAEDAFKAVARGVDVTVPYGSFHAALRTQEWSALEPGVLDAKFYVRGIGEVFESSVTGPREVLRLVDIIP